MVYVGGMKNVVLALLVYLFATPALALELALPVACEIGSNCWVQQYADHDSSTAAKDFTCGSASYDGHDGVDIRVQHTAVKVDVIAAAQGTVKGVRDGVLDNLVKSEADSAAVRKIECGNGVVLDHGDGWETQYCHMRKGSVAVKNGDVVALGQRLGEIGYSGNAAFPHVHVTVRSNGKVIDPFSADGMADCAAADRSLWTTDAQQALRYKGSEVIQMQWADRAYDSAEIDAGILPSQQPDPSWPALVAHVSAIVLQAGDKVSLSFSMPGEAPVVNSVVMKRHRALQTLHAGKARSKVGWPKGEYKSRFEVVRSGELVLQRELRFLME